MIKKIFLITILIFIGFVSAKAQEVTLFDSEGVAIAYVDYNKDLTIFLWNGTPVAFLKNDEGNMCLFGFNGKFLGWYNDGIIYNKRGDAVGARKGAVNMMTEMEPVKNMQQVAPMKPMTPSVPMQPAWSNSWSNTSLTHFLLLGRN